MTSTAEVQLSANRTMAAYLKAMHNCDLELAANILGLMIDNPVMLAAFIEALAGFTLAMLHTAEALAAATGTRLEAITMLDMLTEKLAMVNSMDDALDGSWHD